MKQSVVLTLLLSFLFLSGSGQDWISIIGKSPYPQGVKVFFTGYDGFVEIELGSIRTTAGGEIDYFTDYHGRCEMSAEGMPSYSLILEHDPVCLEWGSPEPFTCDPENKYFYKNSFELENIDSLYTAYVKADSADREMALLGLDDAMQFMYEEVSISKEIHARTYLLAELLIRRSKLAGDADRVASWKKDILDFATEGYDILGRSEYLGKLAASYLDMNNAIDFSGISTAMAMESDVDTWVTNIGPMAGEKEVVEFFMIHFLEQGHPAIAASLASKYNEIVRCELYVSSKLRNTTMPYTFNVFGGENFSRVYNLDQFYGMPKILAMVSTDCPASVASVAGLYAYLLEEQIRMPVILVHEVEPEGSLADILSDKAPFGLQTGVKTGSTLMFGAGVEQLPAFMILNDRNLQQEIIYDLEDLKDVIGAND